MSVMKEMIEDVTTKILQKYSTKEVVNGAENGQWAEVLWQNLEEYGVLTVGIPEELGGSGGDYEDGLSILRLAGKYSAPIPLAETYIANWILAEFGERITNEIVTVALANTVQIEKVEHGWLVQGCAKNVPWGRFAKKVLLYGKTSDGYFLTLIPLENAAIQPGKNIAGEARDEIIFNQVVYENITMIKAERSEIDKKTLYLGALMKSVMMAGALENILEMTINHTNERSQFGRPINRFQAVQHHLASLAGETAAAGIAAQFAVSSFHENPFSKEIALAKIRINEAAGKATQIAHQVIAAIGFTYEHTLHHSTRRLWSWRDEFGTESEWEKIVTEELKKLENEDLWSMITGVKSLEKRVEL